MQYEVDVLIVGAGLAGIGFAHHLQNACPTRSYKILESRPSIGGTWDLFRYPGVRSDSDMHTYGYSFKPWQDERAIAPGGLIRDYIIEAAREADIDKHIHYGHSVKEARWDRLTAKWTVLAFQSDTGESVHITCSWLQLCTGYYSYTQGYTPDFPGQNNFRGEIIHPQAWPEAVSLSGKRIIVIGSGATAVTLIPSLIKVAGHVVMLQRSPSFIHALPSVDAFSKRVRQLLPKKWAHLLIRWLGSRLEDREYTEARKDPDKALKHFLRDTRQALPAGYDVEKHFLPRYGAWDQRVCVSPDGDFFDAISTGKASVETEEIDAFTDAGIRLNTGKELSADIIITATGLNMVLGGDIIFYVDDKVINLKDRFLYRGNMLSDMPNLSLSTGTFTASYTPRIELVAKYVCRLLNHLVDQGLSDATPLLPPTKGEQRGRAYIEGFSAGYVRRAIGGLPRQGKEEPWRNEQSFRENKRLLTAAVDDGVLQFRHAPG